jgi:hypothetical protein
MRRLPARTALPLVGGTPGSGCQARGLEVLRSARITGS